MYKRPMITTKINKSNSAVAYNLRKSGLSYKQIALQLKLSPSYARILVDAFPILDARESLWTEGLHPSISQRIRAAGYSSKEELRIAYAENFLLLQKTCSLGVVGMNSVKDWLAKK